MKPLPESFKFFDNDHVEYSAKLHSEEYGQRLYLIASERYDRQVMAERNIKILLDEMFWNML